MVRSWPNLSLLPTQLLNKATHNVLQNKAIAHPALCYGPDDGDPRLRKNVASWLTNFYQPIAPISQERICITGGASQNLACLLQVFSDPIYTRHIWIVSPAYMLCFRIFEDAGFYTRLRAVPEDDEGIDIDFLTREIRKSEEQAKSEGNDEPVSRIVSMGKTSPCKRVLNLHDEITCSVCSIYLISTLRPEHFLTY